jgi:hypothetical protein
VAGNRRNNFTLFFFFLLKICFFSAFPLLCMNPLYPRHPLRTEVAGCGRELAEKYKGLCDGFFSQAKAATQRGSPEKKYSMFT